MRPASTDRCHRHVVAVVEGRNDQIGVEGDPRGRDEATGLVQQDKGAIRKYQWETY